MKSHLIRIILGIATLAFILFAFSLGISSIVNTLIEKDVRMFLEFFERAVQADRRLDRRTIFFREFRKMVDHANEMVDALGKNGRCSRSTSRWKRRSGSRPPSLKGCSPRRNSSSATPSTRPTPRWR